MSLKRVSLSPYSKHGGIYILYCVTLKKVYVGQTLNFSRRKAEHTRDIKGFLNTQKFFKLSQKLQADIKKHNLTVDLFRFYPILIIEDYAKTHRSFVANIEIHLIKKLLLIQPLDIWNTVEHDLLKIGTTISVKGKGGVKSKKVIWNDQVFLSISEAATTKKVFRKTIRNWVKNKQDWQYFE